MVADVVLLLIDGIEGITDQDLHLIGLVVEAGRGLCIVVNKWDYLSTKQKQHLKLELERRLQFIDFAPCHFISALQGKGINALWKSVARIYESTLKPLATPELTRILIEAVKANAPPLIAGHRIKLRYAHLGGHQPPRIIIHGNQTNHVPQAYQRYLCNVFRKAFDLVGTPIYLIFKTTHNPFKGQRQRLTPRQQHKRQRMISYHKKNKKK